jgi:Tfp pilus assembly protein PilP
MRLIICVLYIFVVAAVAAPQQEANKPENKQEIRQDAIIPEDLLKMRDPFRKPDVIAKAAKPKNDLEQYPVHEFKLAGVVTGPGKMKAMLLAPNGKTYFVSENEKLGDKRGVIKKITPEMIQVQERLINLLGAEETTLSELHLPAETDLKAQIGDKEQRSDQEGR